jgi:cytochrome oxidase Cu insertion factor (SCO1/SenC/PrrC family)
MRRRPSPIEGGGVTGASGRAPAAAPALAALLALGLLWGGAALAAADPGPPRAPRMQFVPTPAGTYTLQRIQRCPEAQLLDASAHRRSLSELTRGRITLLTFFYTYCTDPLGCPYAAGLMTLLRDRIVAEPDLRSQVRFVSISFDPAHDSPGQLRLYAHGLQGAAPFEWDFLTADSMRTLQPVLEDFGQDVRVELGRDGRPVRAINHMLKLFLIDASGTVREIYALDFLQPEVMLNDIRTLRLEAQQRPH